MLPLGPGLSSSQLCPTVLCDGFILRSPPAGQEMLAVPGPHSPRRQYSREGTALLVAPTNVLLCLVVLTGLDVLFSEQMIFCQGNLGLSLVRLRVIWPLLVVEYELNSVQTLKLRTRGTVVPLRKRAMDVRW